MEPPVLDTPRLRVRPARADDAEGLARVLTDPQVTRFVGDGRAITRDDITASLQRSAEAYARGDYRRFVIEERAGGRVVGYAGLAPLGEDTEVYYGLARDAWGRGYATEAAAAVVRYAFGTLKLPRLVAVARPANLASLRVLEKLGARPVGEEELLGGPMRRFVLERPPA